MKKTVVFDFDGVIHSYTSGWKGVAIIPDPPVEGVKELIERLRSAGYEVVVGSARCSCNEGIEAVNRYLLENGIVVDSVMSTKPPAQVYIDDRAYKFEGPILTKPQLDRVYDEIVNFKPWMKRIFNDE